MSLAKDVLNRIATPNYVAPRTTVVGIPGTGHAQTNTTKGRLYIISVHTDKSRRMSRHAMHYSEERFNDMMTTYMQRAEERANTYAQFDTMYMDDLDELLWDSTHACRDCIHDSHGHARGTDADRINFFKISIMLVTRNRMGFSMNMIMAKIAHHRATIGKLDHAIARAQHSGSISTLPQSTETQPLSEVANTIQRREIHRWCVSMLHNVIICRHTPQIYSTNYSIAL